MLQSYRTTWGQNPGLQVKPRDQTSYLAEFPLPSALHRASKLERQRSRLYKTLTRGKSDFKIKTFTTKGRNFTNCQTHLNVRAWSVFHFGRHQARGTLPTVGHISTDHKVNEEKTFIYRFCRRLLCHQSSCCRVHNSAYDWFILCLMCV